jgi:hypothetical protein
MRHAWLRCDGARLIADASGALVWPEQSLLAAYLRAVDELIDAERA